jgi:replicative DNA helicase
VLLLALCQLNREIEKRTKFIPCVADIRDAGTLEQDADVILLLAWPHRVDAKQPANQYQIFVAKNRNRPINQPMVLCRFDPSRQTITEATPTYAPEFAPFD